jgi:hypothetical protein
MRRRVCCMQLLLVLASAFSSPSLMRLNDYFTVSDSRLPQPGGPGHRIYIPQEDGGPDMHPGTGFPFRRLHTHKNTATSVTLFALNNNLPALECLLNHKRKLRKLCHVTRDPARKTAHNWVNKLNRRMTRRKALELWETKVGNFDVTPQALWPVAKSLMKRDGPQVPTAVHGSLGITCHPNEKANAIAHCLENRFTSHDLCDENHERPVETIESTLCSRLWTTPP